MTDFITAANVAGTYAANVVRECEYAHTDPSTGIVECPLEDKGACACLAKIEAAEAIERRLRDLAMTQNTTEG